MNIYIFVQDARLMNYVQSFESCGSLIFIAKRHLPMVFLSFIWGQVSAEIPGRRLVPFSMSKFTSTIERELVALWDHFWVVVSNMFYFHPYLGKIPILTNIFQMGWNHQPDFVCTGSVRRQWTNDCCLVVPTLAQTEGCCTGLHPYAKRGAIGFSERIVELPFHSKLATQWILPPSSKRPKDFPYLACWRAILSFVDTRIVVWIRMGLFTFSFVYWPLRLRQNGSNRVPMGLELKG